MAKLDTSVPNLKLPDGNSIPMVSIGYLYLQDRRDIDLTLKYRSDTAQVQRGTNQIPMQPRMESLSKL